MSHTYQRTTSPFGTRVLHRAGCHRITVLHRLLGAVQPWAWADGKSAATLAAVSEATHVPPCPACAPLASAPITIPGPRRS